MFVSSSITTSSTSCNCSSTSSLGVTLKLVPKGFLLPRMPLDSFSVENFDPAGLSFRLKMPILLSGFMLPNLNSYIFGSSILASLGGSTSTNLTEFCTLEGLFSIWKPLIRDYSLILTFDLIFLLSLSRLLLLILFLEDCWSKLLRLRLLFCFSCRIFQNSLSSTIFSSLGQPNLLQRSSMRLFLCS